jgi:hypothetical protein
MTSQPRHAIELRDRLSQYLSVPYAVLSAQENGNVSHRADLANLISTFSLMADHDPQHNLTFDAFKDTWRYFGFGRVHDCPLARESREDAIMMVEELVDVGLAFAVVKPPFFFFFFFLFSFFFIIIIKRAKIIIKNLLHRTLALRSLRSLAVSLRSTAFLRRSLSVLWTGARCCLTRASAG